MSPFQRKNENGQSVVETALVMPLLVLILCGILDFGWIYSNNYKVEYAAYTGARYVNINAAGLSEEQLISGVQAAVAQNLADGDTSHVEVTVNSSAREVRISVTYPVKTLTFVASTLMGSWCNLTATDVVAY